jgi:hypothetical protein
MPLVVSRFCSDPDQAVATRTALLAEAVDDDLALVPHHARRRTVWNVRRDGDAYGLRDE